MYYSFQNHISRSIEFIYINNFIIIHKMILRYNFL